MHIDLRNQQRERLFRVQIDPEHPPTVVRPVDDSGPAVHLNWDRAVDDEGHLRHCPACGCTELFARKRLPQVTVFVAILLAALGAMVLFGFGEVAWAATVLGVVLAVDVLIFLFAPRVLVCYRCHSEYQGLPIRRGHPSWENSVDERFRLPGG